MITKKKGKTDMVSTKIILKNKMFFFILCINSFSFCMNQVKDKSTSDSNDFFTRQIIPKVYSNEATLNYAGLHLYHTTSQNCITITPPTFIAISTTHIPYIIFPHNIDEHQQDFDNNWHIKTTIKKYSKTFTHDNNNKHFVYVKHDPLSQFLTTIKKNRHTTSKVFLDKYTQAKILPKGPILAQCTTILSPLQYIHLLRKIVTKNLLISKLNCDMFVAHKNKTKLSSKVFSDVLFTNTILAESICNKLCNDYSFLHIGDLEDQSELKLRHKNMFNFFYMIEYINGIRYKVNPQNIDEHQQNSDGDWIIKTTITKHDNTLYFENDTFIICSSDLLNEWLTDITIKRKVTNAKPLVEIDKNTQTTVYQAGNIIAECTTTLPPDEYVLFLRKIVKKNLLISKYNLLALSKSSQNEEHSI